MMSKKVWIPSLLLALGIGVAWHFKLASLMYYLAIAGGIDAKSLEPQLGLSNYSVSIQALPIQGVERNLSGLTFNASTGTLFSVINRPPKVVELSLDGRLLREIPIIGAIDPEGITHVSGKFFVITEEDSQQIFRVQIDQQTRVIQKSEMPRLGLAIDFLENLGFEGVSWDAKNKRLFVSKEKAPLRIIEISGLMEAFEGQGVLNLQIKEWKSPKAATLFMTDISSVSFHEKTGTLLILSDESAVIVEYAADGRPLGILPMWTGRHGLTRGVPQAEGLAVGPGGEIFIVSEPNLFYRFDPATSTARPQ